MKYVCDTHLVHDDIVKNVKDNMPNNELMLEVASLFKVFGDATRTRILAALFNNSMCVCDIAALLDMSVSAISHQLRILRQAKIVKTKRKGKEIIYSLADSHIELIYKAAYEHIIE